MVRYFIHLAYDGGAYHGWQIQTNAITVQELLNKALTILVKENVETTGCGRTDTGVHARNFYAHFDCSEPINDLSRFLHAFNALLPYDISVYQVLAVHETAHARFDATSRTYEYHICDRKEAFERDYAFHFFKPLDLDTMNQAAALLLQHRDFACFNKMGGSQNGTECSVTEAEWKKSGHKLVFTISANRFLRNMVRAVVGTLLEVGEGKLSLSEFSQILNSGDRSEAGASVPAHGLFLTKVDYPFVVSQ